MSKESRDIFEHELDQFSNADAFREIEREMAGWIGDDSTGHDLDHAWRVFNLAVRIAEIEDADIDIVGASSLTHDIHR
ncbi:hypothetical protein [Haladaptatus sp. NG-WS-4]